MLYNIKPIYLHCVFHGIRFKVNNEDWLSGDSLFFFIAVPTGVSVSLITPCVLAGALTPSTRSRLFSGK